MYLREKWSVTQKQGTKYIKSLRTEKALFFQTHCCFRCNDILHIYDISILSSPQYNYNNNETFFFSPYTRFLFCGCIYDICKGWGAIITSFKLYIPGHSIILKLLLNIAKNVDINFTSTLSQQFSLQQHQQRP